MQAKYESLAKIIQCALRLYGVVAQTGLVTRAYCSGDYDLSVDGKKIAGMSQHWFRNRRGIRCVVTNASINVDEAPAVLADVINAFYESAGSPVRCQADVLANVRLCIADGASTDLVPPFMQSLASLADRRAGADAKALAQAIAHGPVI
jgi:hypothetical protein